VGYSRFWASSRSG